MESKDENKDLEVENEKFLKRIDELGAKLDTAQAALDSKDEDLAAAKEEVENLSAANKDLIMEVTTGKNELSSLRNGLQSQSSSRVTLPAVRSLLVNALKTIDCFRSFQPTEVKSN
eukprot:765171_1